MNIKEAKNHLRSFMRDHYSDERLAWLLAHALSGRLAFNSCCCFIGVATARHALKGELTLADLVGVQTGQNTDVGTIAPHYDAARSLPGSSDAERAYRDLAVSDFRRQRMIIPMIRSEQRRRERARLAADQLDAFIAQKRQELVTA